MKHLAKDQAFYGVRFDGCTYDTGSKPRFLVAHVAFALQRPDIADGLPAEIYKHL